MLFATIVFIAFFVGGLLGYLAGVWKQGNKDKQTMYEEAYKVNKHLWDITEQIDSEEWKNGAWQSNKMYQDAIFKVFYGERPQSSKQ